MTQAGPQTEHLAEGQELRIVKLRPDGTEAATYGGTLVTAGTSWVVAHAVWTFRRMDLGYLLFEPDDYLLEYFSTIEPFNAFALFSPGETFKGWYCNVTYPTTIAGNTVYWHDLYVDVVQQPDGTILVLDEDELAESLLHKTDPDLHRMILDARDSVVTMMREQQYPFSEAR